ncbi:anti-sigma factor [Streptomyces sp. NPDC054841]
MKNGERHAAVGAYVLHALPDTERRAFEEHLASCDACRAEVAQLSATTARLGQAVAAEPPADLQRRVLERIAVTPQDPIVPRQAGVRGRDTGRRLLQLALAACLALAAVLGGVAVWEYQAAEEARSELAQAEERYAGVADILAAPDVELHTQTLSDGTTGTIAVSRSADAAAFIASRIPPLPADKTYALWFSDDGTFRPAGLVSGVEAQEMQMLDGPVNQATAVGITVEPIGGSPQPTSQPLGLIGIPT